MIIFIGLLVLGIVGPLIHLLIKNQSKSLNRVEILETFLVYQFVFSIGLTSLLSFIGLTFMPNYVAQYSGWQSCQFTQLLGNVNLSFFFLGMLCIWFRGNFWVATALGFSIWIFSDGISHLADMIINNNYAPGNVGIPLYTDIMVPVIIITALFFYLKAKNSESLQKTKD